MSGDYSRWTFDPRNDTVAVLQQQGRLWTDADWNEQATAAGRRTQAESLDVVGRAGIPQETPDGFKFTIAAGEASIGMGRAYVDGILVENHGARSAVGWNPTLAEPLGTGPTPYTDQPYLPERRRCPRAEGW